MTCWVCRTHHGRWWRLGDLQLRFSVTCRRRCSAKVALYQWRRDVTENPKSAVCGELLSAIPLFRWVFIFYFLSSHFVQWAFVRWAVLSSETYISSRSPGQSQRVILVRRGACYSHSLRRRCKPPPPPLQHWPAQELIKKKGKGKKKPMVECFYALRRHAPGKKHWLPPPPPQQAHCMRYWHLT